MNTAHLHLMITHLPIFGALIGILILLYGMYRKSEAIKSASYLTFILSAIGAGVSYATGEGAEEIVEGLPGVMESIIEQHEDYAMYALISLIALGVLSLLALILSSKQQSLARLSSVAVLVVSMISLGLVIKTGQLGGQIRHTEIRTGATATNGNIQVDGGGDVDED